MSSAGHQQRLYLVTGRPPIYRDDRVIEEPPTELRYVTAGRTSTHLWRYGGDALCGRHVLSGRFLNCPTYPMCADCMKELAYLDNAILPPAVVKRP